MIEKTEELKLRISFYVIHKSKFENLGHNDHYIEKKQYRIMPNIKETRIEELRKKGCGELSLLKLVESKTKMAIEDTFKVSFTEDKPNSQNETNFKNTIIIIFSKMAELTKRNKVIYKYLVESEIRKICNFKNPQDEYHSSKGPYPIILIGFEDWMFIEHYHEVEKGIPPEKRRLVDKLNLDSRVNFWDSSIWHRYVPLMPFKGSFEDWFNKVFLDTLENCRIRLYQTTVAREFLEFQTRLLVNSFITPLGSSGHGSQIVPFKFHSETVKKELAKEEIKKCVETVRGNKQPGNKNVNGEIELPWRFLLIDDYGKKHLRIGRTGTESRITKENIIQSIIKKFKVKNVTNKDIKLVIDVPDEIEGTVLDQKRFNSIIAGSIQKLEKHVYDVVLLDYLLSDIKVTVSASETRYKREYGSDLLEIIDKLPEDHSKMTLEYGPLGRFWIFPISSFSHTMLDELRAKGHIHLHKRWYLESGADPVNTPYLFAFKLFRLLNQQIRESKIEFHTLADEYFKKCKVESVFLDLYRDITAQSVKLDQLYRAAGQDSLFADWVTKEWRLYSGLEDHLCELFRLLAFAPDGAWPLMAEEFRRIEHCLNPSEPKNQTDSKAKFLEILADEINERRKKWVKEK